MTRRGLATWLIGGALAVVAFTAAFDAIRNGSEARRATPRAAHEMRSDSHRLTIAAELRAVGAGGVLYVIDEACRVRALRLPGLHPAKPASRARCRFPRSPDLPSRARALLRRGVAAALGHDPGAVSLAQAIRLNGSRLAAIVTVETDRGRRDELIVVYESGKVVGQLPWFRSRSARFHVSPRGSFFSIATTRPDRFFLLDRNARPGALPDVARTWFGRTSLLDAKAIAWSPDERWTALAKSESVYLFTTDESEPYLVRLPVAARELAWRPGAR